VGEVGGMKRFADFCSSVTASHQVRARENRLTSTAAEMAPPAPRSAAVISGMRSGVSPCKLSRSADTTISEIATIGGLGQAMHNTVAVKRYARKCSVCHPRPVRGTSPVGRSEARASAVRVVAHNSLVHRVLE